MGDALQAAEGAGGLLAVAVALFFIARSIRADARLTKRWSDLAHDLESRLNVMERALRRQRARTDQLEGILREAGLPIPPWPDDPEDASAGAVILPTPRSTL